MKLLENTKLDVITSALCMDTGDCKIMGRYVPCGGMCCIMVIAQPIFELPNNLARGLWVGRDLLCECHDWKTSDCAVWCGWLLGARFVWRLIGIKPSCWYWICFLPVSQRSATIFHWIKSWCWCLCHTRVGHQSKHLHACLTSYPWQLLFVVTSKKKSFFSPDGSSHVQMLVKIFPCWGSLFLREWGVSGCYTCKNSLYDDRKLYFPSLVLLLFLKPWATTLCCTSSGHEGVVSSCLMWNYAWCVGMVWGTRRVIQFPTFG